MTVAAYIRKSRLPRIILAMLLAPMLFLSIIAVIVGGKKRDAAAADYPYVIRRNGQPYYFKTVHELLVWDSILTHGTNVTSQFLVVENKEAQR